MSQIPTRRTEFLQRYATIELDLSNGQVIQQLSQAGLSRTDLRELTSKDGHRLVMISGKLREVANTSRNNRINAEEAFFFFEEKDKNGTWDSVDPDNTNNPNQMELVKRIRILGEAFEQQLAGNSSSTPNNNMGNNTSGSGTTAADGSIRVPKLADLTLDAANQFFAQHPGQCYDRPLPATQYTVKANAAKALWDDDSLQNNRDLLTKLIQVGDNWEEVPTHIRQDSDIRPIAYQNSWQSKQRDLLRYMLPGEWFIGSSHHNPGNRQITRQVMQDEEKGLEMLKFSITHIRNYIGIRDTRGKPGMVGTDSPRSYANKNSAGHVNPKNYPALIWRVRFLEGITPAEQRAYINNIRTWSMLMHKVTKFPPDYNGTDNLMTNTMDKVVGFGADVLDALSGSRSSLNKLHQKSAQVYCSESGMHLALNLGLNAPLNKQTVSQLFGASTWPKVLSMVNEGRNFWKNGKHLDYYGSGSDGYVQNSEQNRMVDMEEAPDWLKPLKERMSSRPLSAGGLVFRPWDSADMIEHFIKTAVPRKGRETWAVSNTQAELLGWAKPGIFHSLGFGHNNPPPPPLVMLFDTIISKVRQTYDSYDAFRAAIQPELMAAQQIVAPKSGGEGAFVPPHMVTSIEGDADELIALEPVGQLFHIDTLQKT
ncbi:MAG: Unknown protein [uncultured Thiotrichaceae bacterium]|uniref:Uncharacterized protein n=1 Tax=uncultured Thiotrichaceae bacterium TaxID=298394 RepID=A0A6S6TF45_9GAMM|nr:MAG: Unknown protein [uncultured Thiotrichaceae bacterium]